MREGLGGMLAGDVHRNPRLRSPMLALKACYHGLRAAPFGLASGRCGHGAPAAVAAGAGTESATAR